MDKITLANLALQHIGTRSTISDVDEDSDEAIAFSLCYQQAVDATLTKFDWGFAKWYLALAQLSASPPPSWSYQYAYPGKALRVRGIVDPSQVGGTVQTVAQWQDGGSINPLLQAPRFEVNASEDNNGNDIKVINTNTPGAWAIVTRQISSIAVMPPPFIETMSYKLAQLMCLSLSGDADKMRLLLQLWQQEGADAATEDASEGTQINNVIPEWGKEAKR